MSKIPFGIKFRPQIESGEYKVVTGDDRQVRIISWDKKVFGGRYEIVALVPTTQGDTEAVQLYCPDGTLISSNWNEKFKLFIVTPEEEMTDFEAGLFSAFSDGWQQYLNGEEVDMEQWAKEHSEELLSIAREQLIKDGYVIEKKAFHDAVENISDKHLAEMSIQYSIHCKVKDGTRNAIMNWDTFQKVAQKFIDIGKEEALKDLPRWKKAKEYMKLGPNDFVFTLDSDGKCSPYWDTEVEEGQFYITESDIENLPKEDEK